MAEVPNSDAANTDTIQPYRSGLSQASIAIAYEDWGNVGDPPVLLIMGIGGQMLLWPDDFCAQLVGRGYRVIRFDNRDVGLSGKTKQRARLPNWLLMLRAQLGRESEVPYTFADMAGDAIALLDHLGISSAHIVGASMGGMIAQVLAAEFPRRVNSLTILFSSTNQPLLPPPSLGLMAKLFRKPKAGATAVEIKEQQKALLRALQSASYPWASDELDGLVDRLFERGFDSDGTERQLAALLGTGDLRRYDRQIRAPTLVIHGDADRMLPLPCGKAVARAIPGSKLEVIQKLAHDLPRELRAHIIGLLVNHFRSAGFQD